MAWLSILVKLENANVFGKGAVTSKGLWGPPVLTGIQRKTLGPGRFRLIKIHRTLAKRDCRQSVNTVIL